ncbi:unnamed protein product [Thelazia callipaeda]|uniref:Uncharacterized protein n=1 Tax=Thelazia callipaeda TaxID=103827 RepID=A0A0N5CWA8_THECL|nr:unnamed protein product [Thelazia callipaeda]
MKLAIFVLVISVAVLTTLAENEENTGNDQANSKRSAEPVAKRREERAAAVGYDPAVMAPELNQDSGLLFRRKIRAEEGCCCC